MVLVVMAEIICLYLPAFIDKLVEGEVVEATLIVGTCGCGRVNGEISGGSIDVLKFTFSIDNL